METLISEYPSCPREALRRFTFKRVSHMAFGATVNVNVAARANLPQTRCLTVLQTSDGAGTPHVSCLAKSVMNRTSSGFDGAGSPWTSRFLCFRRCRSRSYSSCEITPAVPNVFRTKRGAPSLLSSCSRRAAVLMAVSTADQATRNAARGLPESTNSSASVGRKISRVRSHRARSRHQGDAV